MHHPSKTNVERMEKRGLRKIKEHEKKQRTHHHGFVADLAHTFPCLHFCVALYYRVICNVHAGSLDCSLKSSLAPLCGVLPAPFYKVASFYTTIKCSTVHRTLHIAQSCMT